MLLCHAPPRAVRTTTVVQRIGDVLQASDAGDLDLPHFAFASCVLHSKITQKTAETLLVGVVTQPRKSPMLRLSRKLKCPGFLGGKHRVIEANSKQNGPTPLPFLGEGFDDLVLNPFAGDRCLREHKQHFVPKPDSLIERVEDLGANLHILRGKPAAHAIIPQIGVQPADELLVICRVVDEARVVLDSLVQQRGTISVSGMPTPT